MYGLVAGQEKEVNATKQTCLINIRNWTGNMIIQVLENLKTEENGKKIVISAKWWNLKTENQATRETKLS